MQQRFLSTALLIHIFFGTLTAQQIIGYVLEAETGQPLPYAHVQLETPAGEGTITNFKGKFQFTPEPNWPQSLQLRISSIGHITQEATVTGQKIDTIFLPVQIDKLQEITIVANDYERKLLRRVIAKIPENYPVWKESLTGIVTENGFLDSLQTQPLYEATATIKADKASYANRQDIGNITVLDGHVRTFPELSKTSIRIIAGTHNVHRFDVVQLRFGPLRAASLNSFDFYKQAETTFDGQPILPIKFKNKNYTGTIYINMKDTAVHEMEVVYLKPESYGFTYGTRMYLRFKVGYSNYEGRYRMRYINYSTGFEDSDVFYLENTFSIESFSQTKIPIPVANRVFFNDKLIDLVPLQLDEDSSQPLISSPRAKFYSRISIDYGYAAMRYQRAAFAYAIPQNNGENANGVAAAERGWRHMPILQFNYRITNHWQAGFTAAGTRSTFTYQGIGIMRRQPFGFSGKWVVSAGLFAGFFVNTTPLISMKGSQLPAPVAGKDPSAAIHIAQEETQLHFTPQLSLSYRIWNNWNVKLSGNWVHSWEYHTEQVYTLPKKWYRLYAPQNKQPVASQQRYTLPILLQVQLIYRGF